MKTVTDRVAQGDTLIFLRPAPLPEGAKLAERKDGQPLVVTHSETGHHHSVHDAGVEMFADPSDPLIAYLRAEGPSFDLQHHRPHHTHETVRFLAPPGTIWEVRKQREARPDGWAQVQD